MKTQRPDWSRRLPQPLVIGDGEATLITLADVRDLIEQHLPAQFRQKATWKHVEAELAAAALGGDPIDVAVLLRMAFTIEGVPCRPAG